MESIYRALIEAMVRLDSRQVPDEIADDDVRALEAVFAEIAQAAPAKRRALLTVIEKMIAETIEPGRIQSLKGIAENLANRLR